MKKVLLFIIMAFSLSGFADVQHARGYKKPADWATRMTYKSAKGMGIATLPDSFDWRTMKTLSPIMDQGNCGSCWAFSATATFKDAQIVQGGIPGDASVSYVLDCNRLNYGCDGGYFDIDSMFASPGAVKEAAYRPYTPNKGNCVTTPAYDHINEWHYVPLGPDNKPSVEEMKAAIYAFGPISVGVSAGNDWDNYRGGIKTSCPNKNLNHAVQLVGWGPNYWILRNSWGQGWGENGGFMRLAWGCDGVGDGSNYMVYRGQPVPGPTPTVTPTPGPTPGPIPPPCTAPVASTGHSSKFTMQAGKQIMMGVRGTAGVTYSWSATPPFDGNVTPKTAQFWYKPRITKTLTVTATNECGSNSASSQVVIPYADEYYQ